MPIFMGMTEGVVRVAELSGSEFLGDFRPASRP